MKKVSSLLVIFSIAISFSFAQNGVETTESPITTEEGTTGGPMMTFESTTVDYGTIAQHSEPFRYFNFTNTGDEPLLIKHAKGSCGCTVPTYPKEPIMPGETNQIKVRYATNRVGPFTKTITLTTNAPVEKQIIKITGKVLKEEKTENESVPAAAPAALGGK